MTATNGVTPLLAAVSKGHASVIELLINKGMELILQSHQPVLITEYLQIIMIGDSTVKI